MTSKKQSAIYRGQKNPGLREAETGGRKQPDRAGGAFPETDARRADGFFK